jgi:hypothetical protein
MASNAKKKTTMAKLNRERRLRERRQEKQARKEARRQASADAAALPGGEPADGEFAQAGTGEDTVDPAIEGSADA